MRKTQIVNFPSRRRRCETIRTLQINTLASRSRSKLYTKISKRKKLDLLRPTSRLKYLSSTWICWTQLTICLKWAVPHFWSSRLGAVAVFSPQVIAIFHTALNKASLLASSSSTTKKIFCLAAKLKRTEEKIVKSRLSTFRIVTIVDLVTVPQAATTALAMRDLASGTPTRTVSNGATTTKCSKMPTLAWTMSAWSQMCTTWLTWRPHLAG